MQGKLRLDREFAINGALALAEEERSFAADDLTLCLVGIAGAHRMLELHAVERGEERGLALCLAREQDACGLCEDLAEDHARNDRIPRKMPLEKELLAGDGKLAVCGILIGCDLVEEQHIVPVRDDLHDFFSVHGAPYAFLNATTAL